MSDNDFFVHPTSIMEDEVQVGNGTKIWHFCKLMGPCSVGNDCVLGQNVVVERNVKVGNRVRIQNNVSIYSGVELADDVFCGPSMVFTNVSTPRSHYPRREQLESTKVDKGASIGANATIICGTHIGEYAMIGAGSVVTKDVVPYGLMIGVPARLVGFVCYCGTRLPFVVGTASDSATCAECQRHYRQTLNSIEEL